MPKNYLLIYSEELPTDIEAIDEATFKKHRNLSSRIRRMLISSCKTLKEQI